MAGKSYPKDARLLEVTSQCFLDYCIYQLWKEFKEKRSFSDCWRDEIQGKADRDKLCYSLKMNKCRLEVALLFTRVNVSNFLLFLTDFLANRRFDIGEELSNKLNCIRFIVGLLEHQEVETCVSQESSDEEDQDKGLRPECLKFFDKISGIYPFSDVEKSHMRNTLKLQVNLYLIYITRFSSKQNALENNLQKIHALID